jgi:hypothetical protein
MDDAQKIALAAFLFERLDTAVRIQQCGDKLDHWTPEPGRCHENVALWIKLHPSHRPIRGWLYAPYLTTTDTARFLSHSIVETETGELMDVTLPSNEWAHPFIRHEGSEDEFLELIRNNGTPWLDHRIEGTLGSL